MARLPACLHSKAIHRQAKPGQGTHALALALYSSCSMRTGDRSTPVHAIAKPAAARPLCRRRRACRRQVRAPPTTGLLL